MGRPEELQAEARDVLARLAPLGPLTPIGSFVSGLMVWRDLDVMMLGGPEFTPLDVVRLLGKAVGIAGVSGFTYADERSGPERDQRYHVILRLDEWRVDLSIWLHHDHADGVQWHRDLAARITEEERAAILAIKVVWHRRPEYPDEVSGFEIYTAVLEHGVRTAVEFGVWLRGAGLLER